MQSRTKGVAVPVRAIDEIQEQKHKEGLVCLHCKNHSIVRFGKYAVKSRTGEVKRQRYRCKSFRQMFNDLTNTPLKRTRRPHIWIRFIECMIEGYSLRKCAEQLNGEVTHITLFYWRHKILAALKQIPTEALTSTHTWSLLLPRYLAFPPRLRCLQSAIFRLSFSENKKYVSSISTIPWRIKVLI